MNIFPAKKSRCVVLKTKVDVMIMTSTRRGRRRWEVEKMGGGEDGRWERWEVEKMGGGEDGRWRRWEVKMGRTTYLFTFPFYPVRIQ